MSYYSCQFLCKYLLPLRHIIIYSSDKYVYTRTWISHKNLPRSSEIPFVSYSNKTKL